MDSLFNKGFKGAKCRTLLKLTVPRIKLLRNRREIQLKQMRREIAKLLEIGQEATARIKVEHIIREEKMMAAQEIVELFCELIIVRLPIIEAQRECPLDLKEAISSLCFAAPRCADLLELLQVQLLFAGKYGKEFVAAATELRPECGVNRQLIELLSVRAPPPEAKLKLLKEIAEEHELDWDPSASENELLKPHEDLLNGPAQFVSGSKVPLPEGQHAESLNSAPAQVSHHDSDSDDFETIDFPEVPTQPLRSGQGNVSAPEMLPFPASALSDVDDDESPEPSGGNEIPSQKQNLKPDDLWEKSVSKKYEQSDVSAGHVENKQFLPFISPPSSASLSRKQDNPLPPVSRTKSERNIDLQDVLAAAQAAAETAERAAAAARQAASLAQLRISELVKKNSDASSDCDHNPFHEVTPKPDLSENPHLASAGSSSGSEHIASMLSPHNNLENNIGDKVSNIPSYDGVEPVGFCPSNINASGQGLSHQFQRLPSMDDDPYFSYPNVFTSQNPNHGAHSRTVGDNSNPQSTLEK